MKGSRGSKKFVLTKEMAKKFAEYLDTRARLKKQIGVLIGRVEEKEECPSICEIAASISDAMFQLHDVIVWLTDEVIENCSDFTVSVDSDLDASTELIAVKGARCGGLAFTLGDLDGKKFSECTDKIREWLLSIADAAC